MKKCVALSLILVSMFLLFGCNKTEVQKNSNDLENKDKAADTVKIEADNEIAAKDNWVSGLEKGTPTEGIELSSADIASLVNIIEGNDWVQDKPKCEQDCIIVLKGNSFYYHSSCGTLEKIDMSTASAQSSKEPAKSISLKLDEKTMQLVNTILEKYIELE